MRLKRKTTYKIHWAVVAGDEDAFFRWLGKWLALGGFEAAGQGDKVAF